MFNQDEKWDESSNWYLYNKITRADGVIIATLSTTHYLSLSQICTWNGFHAKAQTIWKQACYD